MTKMKNGSTPTQAHDLRRRPARLGTAIELEGVKSAVSDMRDSPHAGLIVVKASRRSRQGFSKVVGAVCNRDPYGKSSGLSRIQSAPTPHWAFFCQGKMEKPCRPRERDLAVGQGLARGDPRRDSYGAFCTSTPTTVFQPSVISFLAVFCWSSEGNTAPLTSGILADRSAGIIPRARRSASRMGWQ